MRCNHHSENFHKSTFSGNRSLNAVRIKKNAKTWKSNSSSISSNPYLHWEINPYGQKVGARLRLSPEVVIRDFSMEVFAEGTERTREWRGVKLDWRWIRYLQHRLGWDFHTPKALYIESTATKQISSSLSPEPNLHSPKIWNPNHRLTVT